MTTFPRKLFIAALFIAAAPAFAAGTGIDTTKLKTAPPVSIDLSAANTTTSDTGAPNKEAAAAGDKTAAARASHSHAVKGTLPINHGGTGTATLSCAADQLLWSDGTTVQCKPAVGGYGTIGSPVPTTGSYVAGSNASNNETGVKICDLSAPFVWTFTAGTSKQMVAGATSKKVYICGFFISTDQPSSVKLLEGTKASADCDTGAADVTGLTALPAGGGVSIGLTPFAVPFTKTAADQLCVYSSAAATIGGWISYTQQP